LKLRIPGRVSFTYKRELPKSGDPAQLAVNARLDRVELPHRSCHTDGFAWGKCQAFEGLCSNVAEGVIAHLVLG